MSEAAAAHLEKAKGKLRAARVLLREGEAADSISRSYYAMYNAAKAALLLVGEQPKTHGGVSDRFWVRFVKEGSFPESLGGLLSRAREMREGADYDAFTRYDAAAASDLLEDAEDFCKAAEVLVQELSKDNA